MIGIWTPAPDDRTQVAIYFPGRAQPITVHRRHWVYETVSGEVSACRAEAEVKPMDRDGAPAVALSLAGTRLEGTFDFTSYSPERFLHALKEAGIPKPPPEYKRAYNRMARAFGLCVSDDSHLRKRGRRDREERKTRPYHRG